MSCLYSLVNLLDVLFCKLPVHTLCPFFFFNIFLNSLWKLLLHTYQNGQNVSTDNVGKDVEQEGLSPTAGGNDNDTVTLEDILAASHKIQCALTIQSALCFLVFTQSS